MGILAAFFLVVASICGLLVASALSLYLYHTFPDTWWTEVVKIQVLGGASVALFARELRNNVRLMSKPRYYETDPVNVSLLPNPLPQELIFRCPARCEALHSSPPLPHTRAGSTRQAEVNPNTRRRSKPWLNKMSVTWMTLRPNSPRHVGWPLARPTPALLALL